MKLPSTIRCLVLLLALGVITLWLRWPTFGFSLWNVDEAIHAAAARVILDGGVLYRDAIDQRTPLSYYAVAAVFAAAGENNLWAVRAFIALLVAGTGCLLFLAGCKLRNLAAGIGAGLLYVLLATAALFQGDANAANTEWFAAFFSSAAILVFLSGGTAPPPRRLFLTGLLLAAAFLSKQPALLDLAAPAAALLYTAWRQAGPVRILLRDLAVLGAGWLVPVALTAAYFAFHGALHDAVFYTWIYNLAYYGPEIDRTGRLASAMIPFQLIGGVQPWLLALWAVGALVVLHRLLQRQPAPAEASGNPGLILLTVWSLTGLAGAASGGRGFDHYTIQFLAPFCLGAGLALSRLGQLAWSRTLRRPVRVLAALFLILLAYDAVTSSLRARNRPLPEDPSHRVAAYIRQNSNPADRIFVWGFHPDIYLYADRRPASRFLYASFITGLIPWTNTAPERDTAYAIVPRAMDTLLEELTAKPPLFIVDCSAGPNRHWQKYPLEKFPALHAFVRQHYRLEEPHQFVPQGFRLYQLRKPDEPEVAETEPPLAPDITAAFELGTLGAPLTPVFASARHGADVSVTEGRLEYFVHAPSTLVYRVSPRASALQGGFGIRAGAYAPDNPGSTDGAEFIVRWKPEGGAEQILWRRLLRPREEPADRGLQRFHVALPPHPGGELVLEIHPGPYDNTASDWTFWSGLMLKNYH
ncbi:MAG: glycosyltransferase family 39 protein [Opitutaceae bacterium]|nr:glycosyltransferase family 39 protein [Opitutaceae bacterium]